MLWISLLLSVDIIFASNSIFYRDLKAVESLKPITTNGLGSSGAAGSYVTTVYTTPNCASGSKYTASGYILNSCISLKSNTTANGSFKYSDCSQSGGKTTVTMTYCTSSTDCTSGCMSYQIPQTTSCTSSSVITCSTSDEPWGNDFNYHSK